MLAEIRIESLGAISTATAEFDRGLTVLTGETGTGKTMVVTGLHLLGGARSDATRVRSGADRAVVEGRFTTTSLGDGVAECERAVIPQQHRVFGAEVGDQAFALLQMQRNPFVLMVSDVVANHECSLIERQKAALNTRNRHTRVTV